jgi:signal transduction histidine kinase
MTGEHLRNFKHELRTPVNHILGYSELLLETADDFGDSSLALLARGIYDCGQVLASLLEKNLLSPAGEMNDLQIRTLRSSVGPVVEEILTASCSRPELISSETCGEDLERIRQAAHQLMLLVRVKLPAY